MPYSTDCFGCGSGLPFGLGLRITNHEVNAIHAEVEFGQAHQGAPGIVHGGVLAAALDEATSLAAWHTINRPNVTGRLETQFLAPVPLRVLVHIHARCKAVCGRKAYVDADLRVGDARGTLAARAAAVYIEVPPDRFLS